MFQGLGEDQLKPALEALLFITDEPVSALRLSEILQIDISRANAALDELSAELSEQNRGIQLREVAGGWRLYTHPAFHELLEQYVISWDARKLSPAMMETLAIVAYIQPCTRAQVSETRGVTSDSSINSLVDKGLLREAGNSDAPGNPTLYATTNLFLENFGLKSVSDLPDLEDFVPDAETKNLISERLSAHRLTQEEIEQSQGSVDGCESDSDSETSIENMSDDSFIFDDEDEDEVYELQGSAFMRHADEDCS